MSDSSPTTTSTEAAESTAEITRRRFLTLLFAVASAIGLGALAAPLIRFAYPVLRGQVFERVRVAGADAITVEGLRFDYQETPSMLIRLEDQSFAAYSLVCTHLGCIVRWEVAERDFYCPCHAGRFNEQGEVTAGPPPRPLTKYSLAIEGNDIFVEGIERA